MINFFFKERALESQERPGDKMDDWGDGSGGKAQAQGLNSNLQTRSQAEARGMCCNPVTPAAG